MLINESSTIVSIPGSKSLTNRAILLASLAEGESTIINPLIADDTEAMEEACVSLGAQIRKQAVAGSNAYHITGLSGKFSVHPRFLKIDANSSGTVARFICAILTAIPGKHYLEGSQQLRRRPMRDLVRALRSIGACSISYFNQQGCLPLEIRASHKKKLKRSTIKIKGSTSSQYLSALLMLAPLLNKTIRLQLTTPLVSASYVHMTIQLMNIFGVKVQTKNHGQLQTFIIKKGQCYKKTRLWIEPDASSASYFFALAAINGTSITVRGFHKASHQGDLELLDALKAMGCTIIKKIEQDDRLSISVRGPKELQAIRWDVHHISDVAPTLAATACFARGTSIIFNGANMRVKESNRIEAIRKELEKTGIQIEELADGWIIEGQSFKNHGPICFDSYGDHRIAMALSLIRLKRELITITDQNCVEKTFPEFFHELEKASKNKHLS